MTDQTQAAGSDLLTLAQQCETASPEETRGLLDRAWRNLRGDEYVRTGINHYYTFNDLLDIHTQEAFLGAALMLVPEDTDWGLIS